MDRTLTIYKASAGSGKTYTLALEYIKLLLGVKNPGSSGYALNSVKYCGHRLKSRHRHILAITFTNKATQEMKERIVNELHALSHLPAPGASDAAYAPTLTGLFGCTREELRLAAAAALDELLYDYSGFNVSTIDSFFQQVLREFAREVDRQGDFEVELDDTAVISNGVSMMLDDLNYGNPANGQRMQRWIYDYMLNRISQSGKYNMFDRASGLFANLVEFVRKSCDEDYKESAAALQKYLEDPAKLHNFRKYLKDAIERAMDHLRTAARQVVAALGAEGYGTEVLKTTGKHIERIQRGDAPVAAALDTRPMAALLDGLADDSVLYVKSKCRTTGKGKNAIVEYPSADVTSSLLQFALAYRKAVVAGGCYGPTAEAADNLEFLGFVLAYVEQFRRDNNLILLSDTNDLLDRIIADDDAPFIYERLGVYLHHYLIDEFQDTSRLQWKNLRPLVSEAVHSLNDCLIIGDEKQAIYRFRNSDSSMLHHTVAEHDFPAHSRVRGEAPGENTNYRSAPDMVRFNNTVFGRMARRLGVEGFENVTQTLPEREGASAYIRFARVENDDEALDIMASHILREHDSGYDWRDIAVLVRGNSEAATVVEYLRKNYPQISLLSEEALYLRNSSSVKLITGMLKLLDRSYTDDTDTAAHAGLGDTMAMISRFDYYLAEGAGTSEALSMALGDDVEGEVLKESVRRLRSMHASSLSSLVELIVQQRIPAEQRRREMAFICAFQDMVIEYCKKYPDSVHDFVKWYDKCGYRRALPAAPDIDAVQVMTIHKSKGLEWDCVHIPFARWALTKDGPRWFHPHYEGIPADVTPPIISLSTSRLFELEGSPYRAEYQEEMQGQRTDNLNTTYVAFTRAARELIVSSSAEKVGADLLEVLHMPLSAQEAADGLHTDTAAYMGDDDMMEIGEPTRADAAKIEKRRAGELRSHSIELEDYEVYDRDDTREMVAMPDITTELGAISDDDPESLSAREIVDPIPADARGEDLEQRRQAARRGTLLHAVMAEMAAPRDLDRALERVANAVALDPDTASEMRRLLAAAFDSDDERVARWFDPHGRLLSEQSILRPDGTVLRPDRIVIHSDGSVDLVDYKFTSSMRPSHQRQLRDYCLMLRSMGYKNVSGHLWYPLLGKIATEKA